MLLYATVIVCEECKIKLKNILLGTIFDLILKLLYPSVDLSIWFNLTRIGVHQTVFKNKIGLNT